jgi:serine/threonine-protein kinase
LTAPALTPGTRLGHYEIVTALGAGGMGEVYRATDTSLKRQVAIKVLTPTLAADRDRLARLQREAEVLAALNHQNIAHIHGVEKTDGALALVMELVEGPTLADRIATGPIPLDEALRIAKQVADALEAAHEQGIVHRDLKPANIKVRPDGMVKVLDFGLAKAIEPAVPGVNMSQSPTITSPAQMTAVGVILGTAAYMSPEQASGKPVDRRSDVWSFGVVLWEMLTGERLFDAETVSHTLADVLRSPIPYERLPAKTPVAIRQLLQRCLDRNARNRLRDIGEARIVLENPADRAPRDGSNDRRASAWILAAVAAVAIAITALFWARSARPLNRPLIRLSADLGPDAQPGARTTAALSPDGTRIVFPVRASNGVRQLATRTLDQPVATPMSGTEGGSDAFFSPDGQWIGFFASGTLKKVAVQGGAPVTVCDAMTTRGGSWGEDGTIVFALDFGLGLMRVPSSGGTPQALTLADNATIRGWPQLLPGGRVVLVTVTANPFNWEDADIGVVTLRTGATKIVQRGGYYGRYVPSPYGTGHLLYVHEGSLFAVSFDPARLETSGAPVPILADIAGNPVDGGGQFDPSPNGSLVYLTGKATASSSYPIAWMDRSGQTTPLVSKPGAYGAPRFSPDGTRLAFTAPGGNAPNVWIYDLARDVPTQLTFTGTGNLEMAWAPDGKHIAFGSTAAGTAALWWARADGSGEPQKLLETKNRGVGLRPQSFTPDGRRLAFDRNVASADGVEIWTMTLDLSDPEHPKPGKVEPFLTGAPRQVDAAFSPDGKWMAYSSNESGGDGVFVQAFPGPGGKRRVSAGAGKFPMWSREAQQLFYLSLEDGRIMVADYTIEGDSFSSGKPRAWSERPVLQPNFIRVLDLHPDGRRFAVFPRREAEEAKGNVHVTFLLNFLDELHRRLP